MIYKNLKIIFNKKQLFKLYLILFAGIISTLFEIIGIGSIPIFAMAITDINLLNPYLLIFLPPESFQQIDDKTLIFIGASILGLVFIFKNLYIFFLIYLQGKFIKETRLSTVNKIFNYYITLPYSEYSNINPGIIIRRVQDDVAITFNFILAYVILIREILVLIAIFLLLVVTDYLISIISLLILGAPLLIFYAKYKKVMKNFGSVLMLETGNKNIIVEQALSAIKETKILNRENYFMDTFSKIINKVEKIAFYKYLIQSTPRLFLEVAAILSVAIISVIFVSMGKSSETIIPIISLFAVAVVRLIPGLNTITSSLSLISFSSPSFDKVVEDLKKLKEINKNFTDKKEKSEEHKSKKFNNNINFKDVSYQYKNSERKAINQVNLKIVKGTSVGIIGRSGSGKSTLVDIILGLLNPTKGEVIIDGENINHEKTNWQTQIGYIPQNIYILDDTIKKNILFGVDEKDYDEKLLREVIEVAQLTNLINSLPKNIETFVGNRGAKLSGGERQRIGIARALYNKPKIMVLDEATSSLDIDNENKILKEIYENKEDKTLIIISHRNNTVKYCDLIYVMENGEVVDSGSFQNIMEKHSYLSENRKN